jgi:hypothetical protein
MPTSPDDNSRTSTLLDNAPTAPIDSVIPITPPAPSTARPLGMPWHYKLLWAVLLCSLVYSGYLTYRLTSVQERTRNNLRNVAASIADFQLQPLDFNVDISQRIPIKIDVPFSDTIHVPIDRMIDIDIVVPFKDNITVPINTTVPIKTTVNVPIRIPGLGSVTVPIPIDTTVPVNLTVNVPIDRAIPVKAQIPVKFDVDVPVETTVTVDTTVPVNLKVPVKVPLDRLGLSAQLQRIADNLNIFADTFSFRLW